MTTEEQIVAGGPVAGTDRGKVTVLRADWVLPMSQDPDHGGDVITDGAVVVHGSEIGEVGEAVEVLARWPDAEVVHLVGRALVPGLVNAHTHLAMTMFRGVADDRSLDEFLATVVPLEARLLDARRVEAASLAAMVESHLAGVTTAVDMYFFADAVLAAAEQTGFRVVTGPVVLDAEGPDTPGTTLAQRMELASRWFGANRARAHLRPAVAPHSTYLVSPTTLRLAGQLADDEGAVMHIHAAETVQEVERVQQATGSRPVELLDELGLLGPRTVVAHGVHLSDAEIEALSAAGATVAHCPASNLKLGSGVAPVAEMMDAGVNVALGTDGAASSNDLDVLGSARLAALLAKVEGGSGSRPTAVPARAALAMATCNGARAAGLEGTLGVLAPGAAADVVAIDLDRPHTRPVQDVHSAIVYAAGRGDVTDVWSSGVQVVAGGRHQLVDAASVAGLLAELGAEVTAAM